MEIERIQADVLCVGGGIGGLMAAMRASELGAKAVVAEKGNAMHSGKGGGGCDHYLCYIPEVHGPDGSSRQKFTPTQVVLRVDNRWRSELHPFDRVLMTFLTFPFLRRYGYPIRTKGASRREQ